VVHLAQEGWNSNEAFGAAKGFPNGRSVKGRQIEAEGKEANRIKARERTDDLQEILVSFDIPIQKRCEESIERL
jgi:hypothetical protein